MGNAAWIHFGAPRGPGMQRKLAGIREVVLRMAWIVMRVRVEDSAVPRSGHLTEISLVLTPFWNLEWI